MRTDAELRAWHDEVVLPAVERLFPDGTDGVDPYDVVDAVLDELDLDDLDEAEWVCENLVEGMT